jgi:CRP/FNR family transcriptional regulator
MAQETGNGIFSFFAQFKRLYYKKNETIIRADDAPQGVFYIKSGHVRMLSIFEAGKQLTLNIFKPGSYFPMIWTIADVQNSYYYQAITDAEVYRAPKDALIEFIKKNPTELYTLTRRILIGLGGFLTNSQHLLFGDAYHRVASVLLLCAKRFGEKNANQQILIKIPLTHQEIANLSGITRETASIEINNLKRKKIISYHRHTICINSIETLEKELEVYNSPKEFPDIV